MIQTERQTKPKVSVIIPCYNSERFLRECLDSIVNQTLRDIEIICVDDGSTDSTPDILRDYTNKDMRVKIISFEENRSTNVARKVGVAEATGEYIMFVDSDDYLDVTACDVMFGIAEESGVDIVQVGASVINCSSLPKHIVDSMQSLVTPNEGIIADENLVRICFERKQFAFCLWGKLYKTERCKLAFTKVDGYLLRAEDLYAFFLIAFYSKTYIGKNQPLYNYCYGRGVSGHIRVDLMRFELFCTEAQIATAIALFLESEGAFDKYRDVVNIICLHLFTTCFQKWENTLDRSDMAKAFDKMVEYWGKKKVILELAKKHWHERTSLAKALLDANTLKPHKGKIKTIATYFHHANNGGIQRVNAELIPIWMNMGYKVILLTDDLANDDDYDLPESLIRIVLPAHNTHIADMYEPRFAALAEVIGAYDVDALIYHAYYSDSAFWDMLTVKSHGCQVVMYIHSVFSRLLADNNPYFAELPIIYKHFDAVLTLSKTDAAFWQVFNNNTFQVYNPLTFNLQKIEPSPLDSPDVLWLARLASPKNPMHAVRIIELAARKIPDIRLHIVGKGEPLISQIEDYIKTNKLSDNVILHGFTLNVDKYYINASIFLMTSDIEGLPLTLLESKSYGIPCVCYEMPYLDLCQDGRGIVSVPHGDITAAAEEVVRLLQDSALRKQLGADARASADDYAKIDIQKTWYELFDYLEIGNGAPTPYVEIDSEVFSITMQTISLHSNLLRRHQKDNASTIQRQRNEITSLNERITKMTQTYTQRTEADKKRIESYQHRIEAYKTKVEIYQERIAAYKVKAATQKERDEAYKASIEAQKLKIADLKNSGDRYRERLEVYKEKEETYKQKIAAYKSKEAAYKQKLDDIYRSRSWKLARIISAPLRMLRSIVSGGR